MDWRSLGGLPGGLRVCGDGIVMLFLSGPGKGWGTGGCTAVHAQEVARQQLYFRMLILCSVVPGTPDGVPHSGVRFEHRCYYWDRYVGILISLQSGEDWVVKLDDDLSRPASPDWRDLSYYCPPTRGYHVHHATRMDPV